MLDNAISNVNDLVENAMNRLMMIVGSIAFGYAGSFIAGLFGASDLSPSSLMMSLIGGTVGLFAGWYAAEYWI